MRKTSLNTVYELAKKDDRIVFIGSDLGPGVLDEFKKNIPNRFFMEGVSEQHIIGMAAGMAMNGFIPYINTIATFLTRRCFEQIVVDLCMQNLPVRLIGSGGGGVYAPLGSTHLAIEDLSIMRTLPNMTVIAPCDAIEMKKLIIETADYAGPIYIRLGKGGDEILTQKSDEISIGKGVVRIEPVDGLFITTGIMTQVAYGACTKLNKLGYECGLIHLHTIKPLDGDLIKNWVPKVRAVITVEENLRSGGFGSAILEYLNDEIPLETVKITRLGISDAFAKEYGNQETLLSYWGLEEDVLVNQMLIKLRR